MCTLSKEYLRSQYKVAVADFKMAQDDKIIWGGDLPPHFLFKNHFLLTCA